jgi:cytochrome P450
VKDLWPAPALPTGGVLPDSVFEFCRAPHSFLLNLARTEGPVARFRLNDESFAVVGEPEAFQAISNGSFDDFEKGELYDIIEACFGQSVFTVDGAVWKGMHDVITPLFSRERIAALAPVVRAVVARHVEQWAQMAAAGMPVDLLTASKRVAFDVVARGLMSIDDEAVTNGLFTVLNRADRIQAVRLKYIGKRLSGLRAHFQKNPVAEEIDRVAYAMAAERLAEAEQPSPRSEDLIGSAISILAEQNMDADQRPRFVRDLFSSMLSAGYVTTGESIFWSLYLLARYPEAQERARRESAPGASASPWVSAVISESLRLYPPAWFLGRIARRTVQIGSMEFEAGTRLVCSAYVLHRMPALWSEPDEFRPERFLRGTHGPSKAYFPFGTGMRACIGRALALMELSIFLPELLARFEVRLTEETPVTLAGTFSMQPRELVQVSLIPRKH